MTDFKKFQRISEKCRLVKRTESQTIHEFKVSDEDLNFVFSLHGGCTSTILESCMKNAVFSFEGNPPKKPVTVDLCVSFLSAATSGDTLIIETEKIREGRSLAFVTGKMYRKSDNLPNALGKQSLSFASDFYSKVGDDAFEKCQIPSSFDSEFLKKFIEFYNSFSLDGVNYIFDRCKPIRAVLGHIFFEFTVEKEDLDMENLLHKGCLGTLLDVLMSLSIFGGDNSGQLGVTADLNITFMETVTQGEKLFIECKVTKKLDRMAFIIAKAWKIKDDKSVIVATASQGLTVFKGFASSSKL